MNRILRVISVSALCVAVNGCSTPGVKQAVCITAGALAAGAAARYGTDDSDAATAAAAVAGGAIGAALCKDPEPPAPKPAPPAPAPKPKPVPKPDPDTDGDGVPDSRDDCPDTAAGTPVDSRGCPEIPNLEGVHFEFDKAMLTAEAKSIMETAAETLRRNPYVKVEIVGHTDSIGTDSYNQKLSEARARAVSDFLESLGISSERIHDSGRGETAPVADNGSREGRRANRRVELTAQPRS